jgi:disulfide bond formation protein DsbB
MAVLDLVFKRWPYVALAVSAAMLAIAHAFQTFGHLPPCHLCLKQREVYWAAMAVSAVAIAASLTRVGAPAPRIASLILAVVFGYGAYLAIFHAGAEWKWWPAPAGCASSGPVGAADLKAMLSGVAKGHFVACDVAPWSFLGLSMAGWNAVASVGLVGLSLTAAARQNASSRGSAA